LFLFYLNIHPGAKGWEWKYMLEGHYHFIKGICQYMTAFLKIMTGLYEYTIVFHQNMTGFYE